MIARQEYCCRKFGYYLIDSEDLWKRDGGSFCLNSEHTKSHRTEDVTGHPVSTVIFSDCQVQRCNKHVLQDCTEVLPCRSRQ